MKSLSKQEQEELDLVWKIREYRDILVVDVQKDFCEGGSLAVEGGNNVAVKIANLLSIGNFNNLYASLDWHIDPGTHFSNDPDYVDSWPPHCRANTDGARLNIALRGFNFKPIYKGHYQAGYSAFDGYMVVDEVPVPFGAQVRRGKLIICGIATDYCVQQTVFDAIDLGIDVLVLSDLCAAVHKDKEDEVLAGFSKRGARVMTSAEYLDTRFIK